MSVSSSLIETDRSVTWRRSHKLVVGRVRSGGCEALIYWFWTYVERYVGDYVFTVRLVALQAGSRDDGVLKGTREERCFEDGTIGTSERTGARKAKGGVGEGDRGEKEDEEGESRAES